MRARCVLLRDRFAARRHELLGPDSGPIPMEVTETRALDEKTKRELFLRHMQRLQEDEAASGNGNN